MPLFVVRPLQLCDFALWRLHEPKKLAHDIKITQCVVVFGRVYGSIARNQHHGSKAAALVFDRRIAWKRSTRSRAARTCPGETPRRSISEQRTQKLLFSQCPERGDKSRSKRRSGKREITHHIQRLLTNELVRHSQTAPNRTRIETAAECVTILNAYAA